MESVPNRHGKDPPFTVRAYWVTPGWVVVTGGFYVLTTHLLGFLCGNAVDSGLTPFFPVLEASPAGEHSRLQGCAACEKQEGEHRTEGTVPSTGSREEESGAASRQGDGDALARAVFTGRSEGRSALYGMVLILLTFQIIFLYFDVPSSDFCFPFYTPNHQNRLLFVLIAGRTWAGLLFVLSVFAG